MIGTIALWLAGELLKFAAGEALRRALPGILRRLDDVMPVELLERSGQRIQELIHITSMRVMGRLPTPIEEAVIRLSWDPVACAQNRSPEKQ